jgi:hypothetical protein
MYTKQTCRRWFSHFAETGANTSGEIPEKNGSKNLHSGVFMEQLKRVRDVFRVRRPLRELNSVFLQRDNAHPHCTQEVKNLISSFEWTLLPHPPYSPTEAPTDYHVNRSMKSQLRST